MTPTRRRAILAAFNSDTVVEKARRPMALSTIAEEQFASRFNLRSVEPAAIPAAYKPPAAGRGRGDQQ